MNPRWGAAKVRLDRTGRIAGLSIRNATRFGVLKVRRRFATTARADELSQQFSAKAAADFTYQLGNMKGVMMKAGQFASFVMEALPDVAQQSLSSLYADAPPMPPGVAERVIHEEFKQTPAELFLDWQPTPIAAASIGQVHKAVLKDGRKVAVKVQYPGVGDSIDADLNNADAMYSLLSAFALKGLDTKGLVNELRDRMGDELDYTIEARSHHEFADHFTGHPFVQIPAVVPEYSGMRVLTTEWVDGLSWSEFLRQADDSARQRAGESIWRFAQHCVFTLGAFNGDPHPGNYRFSPDGDVTFLDFGLVKRWSTGEWAHMAPTLDAVVVQRDPVLLAQAMERSGFLVADHGLDPQQVFEYVSCPYVPYLDESFTFTREWMKDTMTKMLDLKGPYAPVIAKLNVPGSYVILDRLVWGVSALLGKLNVTAPWRSMLLEYQAHGEPATPMGHAEREWANNSPHR